MSTIMFDSIHAKVRFEPYAEDLKQLSEKGLESAGFRNVTLDVEKGFLAFTATSGTELSALPEQIRESLKQLFVS